MENTELKQKIESFLGEQVTVFVLKGQGMVNNAYYLETESGNKYLVKQERSNKETDEQNDLIIEGSLIRRLNDLDVNLPVPQIAFVSNNPKMYGYKYVDGQMMIEAWQTLSEEQRVGLCKEIGVFHASLGKLITQSEAESLGLRIDKNSILGDEIQKKCDDFMTNEGIPEEWKGLVKSAKEIFANSEASAVFQCIHNDAHNENIIVKDTRLESFIDFGDSEFADAHVDFAMYIRLHPNHFHYILDAYMSASGNQLSIKRAVAYAFMRDLDEIAYYFLNPAEEEKRLGELPGIPVRDRVENYKRLLEIS